MANRTSTSSAAGLLGPAGSWPGVDEAFQDLWHRALDVPGWLSDGQARILFRAAGLVEPDQWIVEIGSHRGRSTAFLASAKGEGVRMLAVDPFDNPRWGGGPESLAAFEATLERFGLRDEVETFRGVSIEASAAWDPARMIGLLFVDGAHDRRSVLADIEGWERRLAPGGLVLFHDAFSSVGVTQALTERHLLNRGFRFLGLHRTLAVFRRCRDGEGADLLSVPRFASHYPYFLRNLTIKWSLRHGKALPPRLLRYRPGDDLF